mmetsp:Transcript_15344/g.1371  ORF Transcript_15344/g.1371 Transcript_15344/m.1371 type:complete len:108 (+) Transcript_15344:52-375(+)
MLEILYHGTSKENARKILRDGFKVGKSNYLLLGEGIYFTKHLEKSKSYGDTILVCIVDKGNCLVIERDDDDEYTRKNWHYKYDSAFLPCDNRFTKKNFSELCIKSPN